MRRRIEFWLAALWIVAVVAYMFTTDASINRLQDRVNTLTTEISQLQLRRAADQLAAFTTAAVTPPATAGWAATVHADDGGSIPLPDGSVLWTMGDTTYVNGKVICGQAPGQCAFGPAHDSFVLQSPSGALTVLTCGSCPFGYQQIPNESGGVFLWTNGGVVDGSTMYVFTDRVVVTGTGIFDFRVVGSAVAEFSASTLKYERTVNLPWIESINSAVRTPYGWRVFGTSGSPKQGDVAAVPFGKLATASAWNWHMGVFPVTDNVGTTVSAFVTGGTWYAFTKQGDVLTDVITELTSTSPFGPWVATQSWTVTPPASGEFTYSVEAHPEQSAGPGQVWLSYATNGGSDSDYHLTMMEVTR